MDYRARFCKEIYQIISELEHLLKQYRFSKNLYLTDTVCRCILVSVFQMIRGVFAALEVKSLLVYEITCRSMIEHVIDLYLIALHNDMALNRQFAGYHKLLLYWGAKDVEFFTEEVPRMEREYREYVLTEFPQIVNSFTDQSSGIAIPDWLKIDKKIRDKYKNHWSGLTFYNRVIAIVVALSSKNELGRVVQDWQQAHDAVMCASGNKWHKMSFKERCATIVQGVTGHDKGQLEQSLGKIDPFLLITLPTYQRSSNFIHPTSYSAVPHLNPATGTFELDYSYTDDQVLDSEKFLFLVLDAAVEGFKVCLPAEGQKSWHDYFHRLVDSSPNLAKWFWNEKENCAARPRHQ